MANRAPVITLEGDLDALVVNNNGNNVSVLIGNGAGAFTAAPPVDGVSRHNDRHNNGGCETRTDLDGLRAAGATSQRTSSRPLATIKIVPSAFRGVPVFAYASIGISMAIPIT
jgi:hypothetical protein